MSLTITISLGVMIALTVFSVVAGANWTTLTTENSQGGFGFTEYAFQIDALTGAIAIIVVIVSIAVLIGIRIMDSGLSDQSIRVATIGISYAGIWTLFSVFAMPLILEIEIFGSIIYILLTIMYAIGVVQKISGGSND